MPLFRPPRSFVSQLTTYDSYLRIRWSDREDRWRVERKISHGQWISPGSYSDTEAEDYIAARDGYVCVLTCKHNQLDDRVLFTLWATDLQRRGGAKAVADEVEHAEEQARQMSRNRCLDELYQMAVERWNYANTLSPTKMVLHPDLPGESHNRFR